MVASAHIWSHGWEPCAPSGSIVFEHVPLYRSNPAQSYDRRPSNVEWTNGSQRLTVLCRIGATSGRIELSVDQYRQDSPLDFLLPGITSA
jgi:hypothetical protein